MTDRDHGPLYQAGVVAELDPQTGRLASRLEWRDPQWSGPAVGHCFKGASWDGDRLLLCTERQVLWVDPDGWRVTDRWTHPYLNDVHHAAVIGGRLFVVSTGLDAVLEVQRGEVVAVHGAEAPERDLRTEDLRPHRDHPNHVFEADGRPWVTRFHHHDCLALDGSGRQIHLGGQRVHDGVVHQERVWFTSVDGHLLGADPRSGRLEVDLDLAAHDPLPHPAGWCRGLWLDDAVAWVGYTRIRATRFRSHLAWVRGAVRGAQVATHHPTRVQAHDRHTGSVVATVPTESAGVDAVFGILRHG